MACKLCNNGCSKWECENGCVDRKSGLPFENFEENTVCRMCSVARPPCTRCGCKGKGLGKGLAADTARTGTPLLSYDSAAMAALSNE